MVELHDEASMVSRIHGMLASREWWLFFAGPGSLHITTAIEEEFYSGEANADLQFFLVPLEIPGPGFFFAHKRRLSREQLVEVVKKHHRGFSIDYLEDQDLCIFAVPGEEEMALAFMAWLEEVNHDHAGDPAPAQELPIPGLLSGS